MKHISKHILKLFKKSSFGFSLLELLIVMAIFSILTTVLVANQRKFGNNIILSGLADDVALSIREAQTYGLGSKDVDGLGSFNNPYGIYLSASNNARYSFFADTNNIVGGAGGIEGYDSSDTIMRTFSFPAGNTIQNFCVIPDSGVADIECSDDTSPSITAMSVTFMRPNPDAIIIANGTHFNQATICLLSQTAKTKQVNILSSGQIEVVDTCN